MYSSLNITKHEQENSVNRWYFDKLMFERLRKAGANLTKFENLGLPKMTAPPPQEKETPLCGVIRRETILPDELNTTDFTREQRKKRTDVWRRFE